MAFALLKSSTLRACLTRALEKDLVLNSRNLLGISFGFLHSGRHIGDSSISWYSEQFDQKIVVLSFEEGFQRCYGGCCSLLIS
jgi:hypothetical protein